MTKDFDKIKPLIASSDLESEKLGYSILLETPWFIAMRAELADTPFSLWQNRRFEDICRYIEMEYPNEADELSKYARHTIKERLIDFIDNHL